MSLDTPDTEQPATVHSAVADVARSVGEAISHLLPLAGRGRRWLYTIQEQDYEAVIIAWPSGSGLRMHDHNGSIAAVHVVSGRLRERYLDDLGRFQLRWLSAGSTTELPATHVHEVINLEADEVVSVHVYSPPLGDADFRRDNEIDIGLGRSAMMQNE